MATQKSTQAAPAASVNQSAVDADTQTLRDTVESIDGLAQSGFSEISAIARLALARLEHPDGYSDPELIAQALSVIWGIADDIENCINSEAEGVGCHYVDSAQVRRTAARNAARQKESNPAPRVAIASRTSTQAVQS